MNTNKKTLKPANGWLLLKHTDQDSIIIVKSTPYANKQLLGREELGAEGMEVELVDIKKAPPAHALKGGVHVTYDTPFPLHVRDVAGVYDDSTEVHEGDVGYYDYNDVVADLQDIANKISDSPIDIMDEGKLCAKLHKLAKNIA